MTTRSIRWALAGLLAFSFANAGLRVPAADGAQEADDDEPVVILPGCVKKQVDVPELKPDIPLDQGDEFALADVKVNPPAPSGTSGTPEAELRRSVYSLTIQTA
jgi:hypothetical protein